MNMRVQTQSRRTPRSSPRTSSSRGLARTPSPMYPSSERRGDSSRINDVGSAPPHAQDSVAAGASSGRSLEVPTVGLAQLELTGRDDLRSLSRSPTPNPFPNRDPHSRSEKSSKRTNVPNRATLGQGHSPYRPSSRRREDSRDESNEASSQSSSNDIDVRDASRRNFSTDVANTMRVSGSSDQRQNSYGAGKRNRQRTDSRTGLASSEQHSLSRPPMPTQWLTDSVQVHNLAHVHPELSTVSESKPLPSAKYGTLESPRHTGIPQFITTSSKDTAATTHVSVRERGQTGYARLPSMDKSVASTHSRAHNEHPRPSRSKTGLNISEEVQKRDFLVSTAMTNGEPNQNEQECTSASTTPSPLLVPAPPSSPLETPNFHSQRSFSPLKHAAQSQSLPKPRFRSTSEAGSLPRAPGYAVKQKGAIPDAADSSPYPSILTAKQGSIISLKQRAPTRSAALHIEKATSRIQGLPRESNQSPHSAPIPSSTGDKR